MNKPFFRLLLLLTFFSSSTLVNAQEVIVLDGIDSTVAWFESQGWWGEENHEEQLMVPRALITGIDPNWSKNANSLPVPIKKEIFYRSMLPLIMHANAMALDRREQLEDMQERIMNGNHLTESELDGLSRTAARLRISSISNVINAANDLPELLRVIEEALYKLDIIPAGLALGQAAYESGYGTSRFAAEGNAFFGQWTFGGEGLVPEQQRTEEMGDHRIAAYDWPFDSVRSYFINLMSHPAYEEFRRLRAEMRRNGEPFDSIKLAEGLTSYSERGHEYVETLQGIMRVNNLTVADNAVFRNEPMRFIVDAQDAAEAEQIRTEIERMRNSGELAEIIVRMDLD